MYTCQYHYLKYSNTYISIQQIEKNLLIIYDSRGCKMHSHNPTEE